MNHHRAVSRCPASLLLVGLLVLSGPARGAWQSAESIRQAAAGFLARQYDDPDTRVEIGHLDPRLRLTRCRQPLVVARLPGAREVGRSSLQIRCPDRAGWKIHIGVLIRRFDTVLVARHSLPRGTLLGAEDVMAVRRDVSGLNSGYFRSVDEIRRMVARRSLRKGRVLTPSVVTPPKLVKRGQLVTILARTGNLTIRVRGKALDDGRRGDTVRVRNTRSRRKLQATVVDIGTVQVNL